MDCQTLLTLYNIFKFYIESVWAIQFWSRWLKGNGHCRRGFCKSTFGSFHWKVCMACSRAKGRKDRNPAAQALSLPQKALNCQEKLSGNVWFIYLLSIFTKTLYSIQTFMPVSHTLRFCPWATSDKWDQSESLPYTHTPSHALRLDQDICTGFECILKANNDPLNCNK